MPTYEYVCKNCGETIEIFQSFSDKPLKKHKTCGGQLQKVFHARGIVFKGSGFYATDSKGSSTTEKGSGDKGGGDKRGGDKSAGDKGSAEKGGTDKPPKKADKPKSPTPATVSGD
jgi:putative FmdB family regulatory protein